MKKITKAVIPAAGFGTRFLPFTKAIPKEMLPIVDTPTIEYIVREAVLSGIKEVLIIINSDKECIKTHFGSNERLEEFLACKNKQEELDLIKNINLGAKISYTYQNEQKGLGHAVLCARDFVGNEPFALLLGDDVYVGDGMPVIKQLINAYEETGASILGTLEVPLEDVCKYGIVKPYNLVGDLNKLIGVVEKPKVKDAPSNLAIGGRYILDSKIFKFLENQSTGFGGEIQLTDSILRMIAESDVYSLAIKGRRYDLGSKRGFLEATIDFAMEREDLSEIMKDIINKRVK